MQEINEEIVRRLEKINYRRRVRQLRYADVMFALATAMKYGVAWCDGGSVANAYDWAVTTPIVAAACLNESFYMVRFGSVNAKKGHSRVRWFGAESAVEKHLTEWLAEVRQTKPSRLVELGWLMIERPVVRELLSAARQAGDVIHV